MTPLFFNKIFNPDMKSFKSGTCAITFFATISSGLNFFFKFLANLFPKNFWITFNPFCLAELAVLSVGSIPIDW